MDDKVLICYLIFWCWMEKHFSCNDISCRRLNEMESKPIKMRRFLDLKNVPRIHRQCVIVWLGAAALNFFWNHSQFNISSVCHWRDFLVRKPQNNSLLTIQFPGPKLAKLAKLTLWLRWTVRCMLKPIKFNFHTKSKHSIILFLYCKVETRDVNKYSLFCADGKATIKFLYLMCKHIIECFQFDLRWQ